MAVFESATGTFPPHAPAGDVAMSRPQIHRHRSATSAWSPETTGFVDEPLTIWQAPVDEPVLPTVAPQDDRTWPCARLAPVPVLMRNHTPIRHTVLLVARQREVRRHLRSCLEGHRQLRVADVASVSAAVGLAREVAVHLIIADPAAWSVSRFLPEVRSILLTDVPAGHDPSTAGRRRHVMQRPFSAETLAATVHLLLREPD